VDTSIDRLMPKERKKSKQIKYAIGMIVTCFNRHIANYTGVIIGWDEVYNSRSEVKLKIDINPYSDECVKQPFYTILAEDNNSYYVAEGTRLLHASYIYILL